MMNTEGKPTLFIIPHTHWEGAVFKTREEYLKIGLKNILKALDLLSKYPHYRFTLDQSCYIMPFLEQYYKKETMQKFISEGRLEIAGGTHVMPDVNMPSGESFIRQIIYAKGYFRRELGVEVTAGWQLDAFGHHAQMPQILNLAGYKSCWFFRGAPDHNTPAEFIWEGIDGSRIPAFWLPYGYSAGYGSPQALINFTDFFRRQFDLLMPYTKGNSCVILSGADVSEPEEHLPILVEKFNNQPVPPPFRIAFATPSEYERKASEKPERPVIKCELNPVFQGTYSSRIELKQQMRELETLLLTAEKFGVLLSYLDILIDMDELWKAWEQVLFNQTHDLISGVSTDSVYEETLRGYDSAMRIVQKMIKEEMDNLCSRIDTSGRGQALVVFNTLGWNRTDAVITELTFPERNVLDLKIFGPDDREVPVQIFEVERYDNQTISRAKICFIARDVPAMGYAVYRLLTFFRSPAKKPVSNPFRKENSMENRYYYLEFDLAGGAITKISIKPEKWNFLSGPANVVCQEKDNGDFWELYRPLDGASCIAMKERHPAPQPGKALFSNQQTGVKGIITEGEVFSEFRVTHLFGSGNFSTAVRLYKDLPRIEIRTRLLNKSQFVRYRVLFPTSIRRGKNVQEIPFGAVERPEGIEFPAQNWVDYSARDTGIALLNRGLPGNNVDAGTLMLSLMRSTRIISYAYAGGYEPGMSSDTGFEMGKELTFDYAIIPHRGDWKQAGIYREGLEFNNPLICCITDAHGGLMPGKWGFLEISNPNIVLSAFKPGTDGSAVLRVYEAEGRYTEGVQVKFSAEIVSAEETNLMEDPVRKLEASGNTLSFDLKPFEIKTIKLKLLSFFQRRDNKKC